MRGRARQHEVEPEEVVVAVAGPLGAQVELQEGLEGDRRRRAAVAVAVDAAARRVARPARQRRVRLDQRRRARRPARVVEGLGGDPLDDGLPRRGGQVGQRQEVARRRRRRARVGLVVADEVGGELDGFGVEVHDVVRLAAREARARRRGRRRRRRRLLERGQRRQAGRREAVGEDVLLGHGASKRVAAGLGAEEVHLRARARRASCTR